MRTLVVDPPPVTHKLTVLRDVGSDTATSAALRSAAAPIRDADGQVIAAVNVSTHADRRPVDSLVEDLLKPLWPPPATSNKT